MARHAVLIKGGIFLELAQKIDVLLVDKTGTFTFGRPKVVDVVAFDGIPEEEVLRLAAIAEKYSEHPLARSVIACAKERGIEVPDPTDFNIEVGMGVTARLDGKEILVGKHKFLQDKGVSVAKHIEYAMSEQTEQGRTAILVANDMNPVGLIAIADEIRPQTPMAIASLKAMGIKKIIMLTGDNHKAAKSVAEEIYRSGTLLSTVYRFQGRTGCSYDHWRFSGINTSSYVCYHHNTGHSFADYSPPLLIHCYFIPIPATIYLVIRRVTYSHFILSGNYCFHHFSKPVPIRGDRDKVMGTSK